MGMIGGPCLCPDILHFWVGDRSPRLEVLIALFGACRCLDDATEREPSQGNHSAKAYQRQGVPNIFQKFHLPLQEVRWWTVSRTIGTIYILYTFFRILSSGRCYPKKHGFTCRLRRISSGKYPHMHQSWLSFGPHGIMLS